MNEQTKSIIIAVVLAAGAWFLWPTVQWMTMPPEARTRAERDRDPILRRKLNLGLDLRGGMHLVLEIDRDKVPEGTDLTDAVERAVEIIRNRVDQFGVAEALVAPQGNRWITVQLPGVKDPQVAKDLIGKTALLEFRLAYEGPALERIGEKIRELEIKPREALDRPEVLALVPTGYILVPSIDEHQQDFLVVRASAEVTGAYLTSARVELRPGEMTGPHVSLEFDTDGRRRFSETTRFNKGRVLAILLDGVVQSAPVIRDHIADGRAIITGQFTMEKAKFLATVLRAGALPAPVAIIEERTVGPTLGRDSIDTGMRALAVAAALVLLFMVIYYKLSGFIACIAMALNIFLVLAGLAALNATLSFPGLAGLVLMIGMGVDANILILERIREELRAGKTLRVGVDVGYQRAFVTIFDSNMTTILTTFFLFLFGSGPVRGFGITMLIGLCSNLFTAVFVTKVVYDFLLGRGLVGRKMLF